MTSLRVLVLLGVLCASVAHLVAQTDATAWDRFFGGESYVFGTEPVSLLKEYVHTFRRGRVLDLAMGEGRNAVYLAKQGFEVTGVDFSIKALNKSRKLATLNNVAIDAVLADLRQYHIAPNTFDLITNIYWPQRDLFPQIKAGLKPGGVFVYEQWHPYGWKTRAPRVGVTPPGFKPEEAELFQYSNVGLVELASIFADYQVVVYREAVVDQSIAVGRRKGVMLNEVSSLIVKKPF